MSLKVNQELWTGIEPVEQEKIEAIIHGFFKEDIEPDEATETVGTSEIPENIFCETACDVAAAAAVAACAGVGGPVVVAACIALAEAGRRACKDAC